MSETILHQMVRTSYLSDVTKVHYLTSIDEWIAFAGEDPAGWTNYRAQEFYASMLAKGMRAQSANAAIAGVAYASRWLAKKASNPALNFFVIQTAKPGNRLVKQALDAHEALKLLDTTRPYNAGIVTAIDIRDRAMIVVGLETGMRRMSMSGMLIEEISTKPYPCVRVPLKGQGKDLYQVPLTDVAYRALTEWLEWLTVGQKIKTGPVFRQLHWRLFKDKRVLAVKPTLDGQREIGISGSMIHKIVQQRAERAGLRDDIHPHLFRHSFATWREEMNMPPQQIASVTGHAFNIGALGGYMDRVKLGAIARESSPPWLVDWARRA